MTREEAITKTFKKYDIPTSNPFFFEILKAIEQESSENAISRSDMLDAIGHGTTYTSEELQRIIKGLPSVNPQPKTGHWIGIDEEPHEDYECDKCGYVIWADENIEKFHYCPNCGAKMIEPQESEG